MAPMRVEMGEGIEIKFAQKLAGNEKESRDKALKKLKKWIQLKSSPDSSETAYTELELLKLWKGLFYCMWMSDKPLVQEQLAEELSHLVHLFPHCQDAITFCSTFFTTMAREWHSIDVLRREKYMMLVRRVLRQSLSLMLAEGGSSSSLSRLTELYVATFARPEDPARLPLGLQLHLVEIFLEEVAKVGGGSLTPPQLATLLAPFVQILKVSKQSTLRNTVTDSIFYHLMRQSDVGILHESQLNGEHLDDSDASDEEEEAEDGEEADGEEVLDPRAGGVDVTLPQLGVDYARLADDLVAAGAEPDVRQVNRAALYRLAQQFRDLSEGVYPLALRIPDNIDSDSDISDEDMEAAVLRLQATKEKLNKDSRKNQKSQKRLRADAEEDPQPKKKKKIKHKMLANGVIDTGEEMMAEYDGAPSEEAAGDAEDQPVSRRKTLKEKRRQKLKEKQEAEKAKQEKKKKKEAKRAKLNGDASDLEKSRGVANGIVLNGDHDKKAGEKASKVEEYDGKTTEELDDTHAEVQQGATPSPVTSKKKKKRVPKDDSVQADTAVSLDTPTNRKKKKKTVNKSTDNEGPSPPAAAAVNGCAAAHDSSPSMPPQKKSKKQKRSVAAASEAAVPANGTSSAAVRSPFDWTLTADDSWDEPAGTPASKPASTPVQKPTSKPVQKPTSKPVQKAVSTPVQKAVSTPVQKAVSTPVQKSPRTAAQQQVAHFVPSKPVPAFVKLRPGKKAGKACSPKSPATPRTPGGTKKVIINLAENKAQGFKEHLITVRNSPQVPHNPHRQPTKGLLKPPPAGAAAPSAGTPTTGRRRSQAADFFSL